MDSQGERTAPLNPPWVRTVRLEHCFWFVAMDTVLLAVGTVELLLLQGRVEVILMDVGTLGVVLLGSLGLEHNPLEGVGGCLTLARWVQVPEGRRVGNVEPLLAGWYEMLNSWLLSLECQDRHHCLVSSSAL